MLLLPSIGTPLAKPTAVTPGIAAILSWIACSMRITCSGSLTCAFRNGDAQRLHFLGPVKPGCTCRSAWNVRIISPEPISSTSASATCTTTSVLRARCRSRLWLSVRPPCRSAARDAAGPRT